MIKLYEKALLLLMLVISLLTAAIETAYTQSITGISLLPFAVTVFYLLYLISREQNAKDKKEQAFEQKAEQALKNYQNRHAVKKIVFAVEYKGKGWNINKEDF